MNLIRNTFIAVVFLQFLGFLYIKFLQTEEKQKINKTESKPTVQKTAIDVARLDEIVHLAMSDILIQKKISLPTSTEYTDNQKPPLPKIAKTTKIPQTKAIQKVYVKLNKEIKLSTKLEKYAKKMLGKKYVWGATGPGSYDCSGFTQKVYKKIAGIKLPRVSYLQAKVGQKISFKQLEQGDMVFFDTEKKRTGKVNHVGIYLKNGNFIHASSGGKKVMITNFRKKKFYKNRFLWGRRVINENSCIAMNCSTNPKSL